MFNYYYAERDDAHCNKEYNDDDDGDDDDDDHDDGNESIFKQIYQTLS